MREFAEWPRPVPLSPVVPSDGLDRVLARIRLRARRRAAWLRGLWQREGAAGGAGDRAPITHAAADACLEGWDSEAAEADWQESDGGARAFGEALHAVEAAQATERDSPLARLEALFGLDAAESDLLQTCLAVALDPALARGFAYLQDHVGRAFPTEDLVARLFHHGRHRVLTPESPLRRWALITEQEVGPGEPRALACDPLILDWLAGEPRLDEALVGLARLQRPLAPLPRWPVAAIAARIAEVLDTPGGRIRVRVVGVPGSGRRTLAAAVTSRIGLPLLVIDGDRIDDADWPRVFLRAQRQAYLDRCALGWVGEAPLRRPWPELIPNFPLQFVFAEAGQVPAPLTGAAVTIEEAVELPVPSLGEREALWRAEVPASAGWPAEAVSSLAARHRLTLAEIAALGRRPMAGPDEAAALVRESSRHRLGDLASFVECPFGWDDLVVPAPLRQALGDLVHEAGDRAAFWEQPALRRLFPQGQGLFALFTGPPGTGKTMAAQVIAAHLGLDLFRISLSAVVSKYVGETSKNLQRVLARAEQMDTVLLFDEADALFGKRTEIKDAHDRFANTDTNYLLQAIEAYRGIALLATNKKANIDPAFNRRIRYVIDFPKPEPRERRRLWGRLIAELAGAARAATLAREIDLLAETVEATGAQIKFAVLAALFMVRHDRAPFGLPYLLRGLERELLKEGDALDEHAREQLVAAAAPVRAHGA